MTQPYSVDDLQERIAAGQVVPVIGAGVSRQIAGLPSWRGVVESALHHAVLVGTASDADQTMVRVALEQGDLVRAAQAVKSLLGAPGGEYPFWLQSTFGSVPERPALELVNAIDDLLCPLVATTNYDRLLSELMIGHPEPITWLQPARMQEALREGGGHVLHIHGIYTDPASVVLGIDNYAELASSNAYEPVLRALWLGRTLLFIGCSFDGLRDPDFSRLLDWAADAFAGSPAKHYALVQKDESRTERVREFLMRWRIQVIPYGPTHNDLALAISRLNPNLERSIARRVRLVKGLVDSSPPQAREQLIGILGGLPRADKQREADVSGLADALLKKQHTAADQLRSDLKALQQLAATMIDPASLDREIDRFEHRQLPSYDAPFRAATIAASAVLALFPEGLLNALKRRSVDIHGNWISGFCRDILANFEQQAPNRSIASDRYSLENAKRVLTSLRAVLRADPDALFARRVTGTPLVDAAQSEQLLVARADRLELRRSSDAREITASLPLDPSVPLRGVDLVAFAGAPAICAYDAESVSVWDFQRASAPVASFSVNDAYGISDVAHVRRGSSLWSVVTTTSGPIHELLDLKAQRSWTPVPGRFLTDPVLLEDGSVFALEAMSLPLIRLDVTRPFESPQSVVTEKSLRDTLRQLPGLPNQIEERLAADREYLGDDDPYARKQTKWKRLTFQWPQLSRVTLYGETLLSLYVNIDFLTSTASLILLLRREGDTIAVAGYFYIDERTITGLRFYLGADERARVAYAMLSEFDESYDLVGWARAAPTTAGLIFVQEGSTLRTHDDMIDVVLASPDRGFACDDSGGLFEFSPTNGSFQELGRDRDSKIRQLEILDLEEWGAPNARNSS